MKTIRKEVRELISVNEKIQSAMQKGDQLTDDEKGLVEMCASDELLASMSARENQNFSLQRGRKERTTEVARLKRELASKGLGDSTAPANQYPFEEERSIGLGLEHLGQEKSPGRRWPD